MNIKSFTRWLEGYKNAWEKCDPEAAAGLFAEGASYHETPFAEPAVGKDAIQQYWSNATSFQTGVEFHSEVLAVSGNRGIARWIVSYVHLPSNVQVHLDGIFLVEMDADNLCTKFEEWWHRREQP